MEDLIRNSTVMDDLVRNTTVMEDIVKKNKKTKVMEDLMTVMEPKSDGRSG